MSEFIPFFLEEAFEALEAWESECLRLEQGTPLQSQVAEISRIAHNLKGTARSVGLEQFGAFIHEFEDCLSHFLKEDVILGEEHQDLFFDTQTFLNDWLTALGDDHDFQADSSELLNRYSAYLARGGAVAVPGTEHSTPHTLAQSDEMSVEPSVQASVELTEIDDLEAMFLAAQAQYQADDSPEKESESATIQAEDGLAQKKQRAPKKEGKRSAKRQSVRVTADKIDSLIKIVGELAIHQGIVSSAKRTRQLESDAARTAIDLTEKLVKELHFNALQLRMQSVDNLFQRLKRTSFDIARTLGKKVDIVLEGAEVELDKLVIERIGDPLTHMVRNSVDHGIEDIESRKAAGKNLRGTLLIKAVQDPSGVKLIIKDDGGGINTEAIRIKAIEKGLISESDQVSDDDINMLIFHPGLSTAKAVTDVSGRGVGMDVVMQAIEATHGSVDLISRRGEGTEFIITLPTSVSILDAIVIGVDGARYAVPKHDLEEIIDLNSYKLEESLENSQLISLRGSVVPVNDLSTILPLQDIEVEQGASQDSYLPALIVRKNRKLVAYKVQKIVGHQQIVVRPLDSHLSRLSYFSGSTIFEDGEPGMILSLPEIVRAAANDETNIH